MNAAEPLPRRRDEARALFRNAILDAGRGRVRREGLPRRAHPGHRRARAHRRRHRLQPLRAQGRRPRRAARGAVRGDARAAPAAAAATAGPSRRASGPRGPLLAYVQAPPRLLRHRQRARPVRRDGAPRARAPRASACGSVEKLRAVVPRARRGGHRLGRARAAAGRRAGPLLRRDHPRLRPVLARGGPPTSTRTRATIVDLFLHGASRRKKAGAPTARRSPRSR